MKDDILTVKDLKAKLQDVPDDFIVVGHYDGCAESRCSKEFCYPFPVTDGSGEFIITLYC